MNRLNACMIEPMVAFLHNSQHCRYHWFTDKLLDRDHPGWCQPTLFPGHEINFITLQQCGIYTTKQHLHYETAAGGWEKHGTANLQALGAGKLPVSTSLVRVTHFAVCHCLQLQFVLTLSIKKRRTRTTDRLPQVGRDQYKTAKTENK